jgi:hypothetical protein
MSENRNNAYAIRNSSLKIAAQLSAVFEKQMSAVEGTNQFHLESVQGMAEAVKLLMETASISQKLLYGDQKIE